MNEMSRNIKMYRYIIHLGNQIEIKHTGLCLTLKGTLYLLVWVAFLTTLECEGILYQYVELPYNTNNCKQRGRKNPSNCYPCSKLSYCIGTIGVLVWISFMTSFILEGALYWYVEMPCVTSNDTYHWERILVFQLPIKHSRRRHSPGLHTIG